MSFEEAQKKPACDISKVTNRDDQALLRHLTHVNDIPWIIGGEIAAGQVTQRFVHEDTLVADSERDVTLSASGKIGAYRPGLGFLLATYSYGETLNAAGAPIQICRPIENTTVTGAERCESNVIGGPVRKIASVMTVELRRFVSSRFAWSPSIQYDFRKNRDGNRVVAVEVPVYFLTTIGVTSPTGGVRFGWRSDTKEVTAVIFVGGAFSMF